jgi:hypothetical protein
MATLLPIRGHQSALAARRFQQGDDAAIFKSDIVGDDIHVTTFMCRHMNGNGFIHAEAPAAAPYAARLPYCLPR